MLGGREAVGTPAMLLWAYELIALRVSSSLSFPVIFFPFLSLLLFMQHITKRVGWARFSDFIHSTSAY